MDNLEFLLQREGDNTWLPLESPDVEILEGRYRIVSRSSWEDREIEIRIVHDALDEVPPVRRVQTRRSGVSTDGLMVVIPYTHLRPGIWELCCSPNLQEGLLGNTWQAAIKLRVLASEVNGEDLSDSPSESGDRDAVGEAISADGMETSPPEETVQDPLPSPEADSPEEPGLDPADLPVRLILDRDSYLAELGEAFLLSGQVCVGDDRTEMSETTAPPPQLLVSEPELRICLRDPQTSEVLSESRRPIPQSILPVSFSAAIYVPFECKTRLILGEIIFSSETVSEVSHTFTIAMPVEHLLEAIADDFGEDDYQAGPLEVESLVESAHRLQLPLETADVERLLSGLSTPEGGPVQKRDPGETSDPELPAFGHSRSEGTAEPPSEAEPTPTDEAVGALSPIPPQEGRSGEVPESSETETESPPESGDETDTLSPLPESPPASAITPLSHLDRSFRALNSEERFWSRLSSLAKDRDLSQWMKRASAPPLPETPFSEAGESQELRDDGTLPPVSDVVRPLVAELEAEEIVVDDDEFLDPPASFSARRRTDRPSSEGDRTPTPHVLPEDRDVPAPLLTVPTEPVAGRPLKVRVELPDGLPRIYVKIWVYDRQSRNIVDGPRWITEFSPNGFDRIEATPSLEVPYGSLEVRVEAIAVEMQTQRESHKATVERTVSPPASPTLPLDEHPS